MEIEFSRLLAEDELYSEEKERVNKMQKEEKKPRAKRTKKTVEEPKMEVIPSEDVIVLAPENNLTEVVEPMQEDMNTTVENVHLMHDTENKIVVLQDRHLDENGDGYIIQKDVTEQFKLACISVGGTGTLNEPGTIAGTYGDSKVICAFIVTDKDISEEDIKETLKNYLTNK